MDYFTWRVLLMKLVAFFEVPANKLDNYVETWEERMPSETNLKVLIPPHTLPEPCNGITGFVIFDDDRPKALNQIEKYLTKLTVKGIKVKLLPTWKDSKLAKEFSRFKEGKQKATSEWEQTKYQEVSNFGVTRQLKILPLLDWYTSRKDLLAENGVSYLIKTAENTILFDLGINSEQSDPSPLLHNMNKLGISLDDIDAIVISHNHGDHTGGYKWSKNSTFSLTNKQINLDGKKIYTPVPMKYPGINPMHSKNPTIICKGVATVGTISNAMFFSKTGLTYEQAVAVNVEDRGVVLIVGCGHQTLPKILERTKSLFNEPIYGIIGGLHYPIIGGPIEILGMSPYRYFGTGKVPWQQISKEDVKKNISLLEKQDPKIVAVSAHDSCPSGLAMFRRAFPGAYRDIKVGEEIII
jgi:7,8-dihydropterin-6-yl-methyl-4-(beta-D-ribofuranosyl)aminobenzene 5'-phosphate synthase